MARRRRSASTSVAEVLLWLLFFALLVPAGFTGWAIGHYTSGNTTVTRTVTVAAGATTTAAQPTTTTAAQPTTTAAQPTTTTTSTVAAKTTTAAAAAGARASAARGKAVFAANGCASCHTFKPAGSTGTVGPDLDTRPAADAKKAKMPLAAFIRQSITDPNAFIAPGYPKGVMPATFAALGAQRIDDLVAFIAAGSH